MTLAPVISTAAYVEAWGRRPRGTGTWMFAFDENGGGVVELQGMYSVVAEAARLHFADTETVYLLP